MAGVSPDDGAEFVRRVGEASCLFSESGTITIVSLVSPYRWAVLEGGNRIISCTRRRVKVNTWFGVWGETR